MRPIVETDTETNQTVKNVVGAYYTHGYLWCSIEEDVGMRQDEWGAIHTGSSATVTIRNQPDITVDDRLVYDGREWIIEYIRRIGFIALELQCHAFDTGGL